MKSDKTCEERIKIELDAAYKKLAESLHMTFNATKA
jgi:hypothetical protein